MSGQKSTGIGGEQRAADYLVQRGYRIAARNYHSRYGEIDLIASNDTYMAFVEVKTRRDSGFSAPREAVTPAKQRKLRMTALCYLQNCPTDLQPRFDVAEVYLTPDGRGIVEYFENAFE